MEPKETHNFSRLVYYLLIFGLSLVYFGFKIQNVYSSNAAVVWGGGGADNKWSTPGNWVGGVAPGTTDDAIFNGTSSKDATIDVSIDVASIHMIIGYNGTITQAPGSSVTLEGTKSSFDSSLPVRNGLQLQYNFVQQSGTFIGGDSNFISKEKSFELEGGTFTPTSGNWQVQTGSVQPLRRFILDGGTINGSSKTLNFVDNGSGGGIQDIGCTGDFSAQTGLTVNVNTPSTAPGGARTSFGLEPGCNFTVNNFLTGNVEVPATATLNVTGSTWSSGRIGAGNFYNGIGGVINFSGTSLITNEINDGSTEADVSILSGGQLSAPNATVFTIQGGVYNAGTITYGGTNIEIDGPWQNSGTFSLSSKNLTLGGDFNSNIACSGNFNSTTGVNSVIINKTFNYANDLNSKFELGDGCALSASSFTADWSYRESATLHTNSTLTISGAVDIGGTSLDPDKEGGGQLLLDTGSVFNFTGPTWNSGLIENGGTVNATTAGPMNIYGGYFGEYSISGIFNAPAVVNILDDTRSNTGDFYLYADSDIFNLGSGTLTVQGYFMGSAGFNYGTGTVVLTGSNKSIYGSNTFYNLTKTSTSADTLTLPSANTQTILNALTIEGVLENNISLVSDGSPEQWSLDAQGASTLCYLDVQDSNGINATLLKGYQLNNVSNNTGWDFVSTPACGGEDDEDPTSTDLSLNKIVNKASAEVGESLTYTITASNLGALDADNTTVSDILSSSLTFKSSTASLGSFSGSTWNIGVLPATSSATLTLVASVNRAAAGTTVNNSATISTTTTDTDSSNDTFMASTAIDSVAHHSGGGVVPPPPTTTPPPASPAIPAVVPPALPSGETPSPTTVAPSTPPESNPEVTPTIPTTNVVEVDREHVETTEHRSVPKKNIPEPLALAVSYLLALVILPSVQAGAYLTAPRSVGSTNPFDNVKSFKSRWHALLAFFDFRHESNKDKVLSEQRLTEFRPRLNFSFKFIFKIIFCLGGILALLEIYVYRDWKSVLAASVFVFVSLISYFLQHKAQ